MTFYFAYVRMKVFWETVMELTQEQIKMLSDYAEKKERVVVYGKNSLGQKFSTQGFIMPGTSNGRPDWITDHGLCLFVGQTRQYGQEIVKHFVPLYTCANSEMYYSDSLYIQRIVRAGYKNAIYENPDFDSIIADSVEKQYKARIAQLEDRTVMAMAKYIGKPVVVRGDRRVLKTVYIYNGNIYSDATDGYTLAGFSQINLEELMLDKEAYTTLHNYERAIKEVAEEKI